MKPIKKKTAKLFISIIAVMAVIGTIFTFVPMEFKSFTFNSVAGSLNQSNEIGSGIYAEYDIDGEFSQAQINKAITTISDVLEDKGYSNSTIYSLEQEKLRIEIGCDVEGGKVTDAYSALKAVGIGSFELRSSTGEDTTYVFGGKHVKDVKVVNYNSQNSVEIIFNKSGEDAYASLIKDASKIYVYLGGQKLADLDSSEMASTKSLYLSLTDYESAENFADQVRFGSLAIDLNPDTVVVGVTSSILNNKHFTTDAESKYLGYSITKVMAIIALAVVCLLGLVFMIVKYGVIGWFQLLAMLFDTIIALLLIWAFPWVEIGLSAFLAFAIGYILLMASSVIFASRFESEYKQGKTIAAAFESSYKKCLNTILAIGIVFTVIFGVVAIVASTELKVFGLITCIFSCLSLFSSLIMLPGFVRIFEAFNDGNTKPYRLKIKEEK